MYVLLLAGLLVAAGWLARSGIRARRRMRVLLGCGLGVGALAFFAFLSFWAEMLWFDALGYAPRFWAMVAVRAGAALAAGLAAAAVLVGIVRAQGLRGRAPVWLALGAGAVIGGIWGVTSWDEVLLFLYGAPTDLAEPMLGLSTGFYLFVLPLLDQLFWLAIILVVLTLASAATTMTLRAERVEEQLARTPERAQLRAFEVASLFAAVVAAAAGVLGGLHLLYSEWGVVSGPGWTDVHVRLPAYALLTGLTLVAGFLSTLASVRARLAAPLVRRLPAALSSRIRVALSGPISLATMWAALGALWLLGLVVAPLLVQWLVVVPNEITFEKPYIAHNIQFTRHGFRLHKVEERQFPARELFTPEMADRSRHLLSEVRLWDWRALDAVYKQFQEIRLYYEFADVDMDRYQIGDRYRQVMISARELEQGNLPPQSRTFVNRRFKYTHGYGLTLTAVSDFTPEGLPDLLVKDFPPRSDFRELAVRQPGIYYGELTDEPAVVNTREQEFDHPSGDENVYTRYRGAGGIQLESLWRKFVFGWRLDGTRFFLSAYPTPETRVMFHRQVGERVRALAPFLQLDHDPYIVLSEGRLYWIIDAYTTSDYYPYSEPFRARESIDTRASTSGAVRDLDRTNYVRNSVKAVVDAFEGTVDLYVFDEADPVIATWSRAFPGLFKSGETMPSALRRHVRYPIGFLLAQGLVYSKYHMDDPEVFYNQEDLWVRATEKYYSDVQAVEPYYVMWQLPGSERAEFVLILPFTPKNRQVLIGWIAGFCDGENYGRFLSYKFPKERRVLGPQQVETKIDQDRFLSGQLTLWDQRGSRVVRGNVLAIPIEDTLLYVEPIYLQAETAAHPELRLVVLMHGDRLSYAETFEEALRGLLEGAPVDVPLGARESVPELTRRASRAFQRYLELQAEGEFSAAALELQTLRETLTRLERTAADTDLGYRGAEEVPQE